MTHHRTGPSNNKKWVDLQLPLYRILVAQLGIDGDVGLGFVHLPKDLAKIGYDHAPWNEDDLNSAIHTARGVIRDIREGRFWPPADPRQRQSRFDDGLGWICMDQYLDRAKVIQQSGNPILSQEAAI